MRRRDEHRAAARATGEMIVELLLAERNHVCAVVRDERRTASCRRWPRELGVDHVRYDYLYPNCVVDATHERFVHRPQPLHALHPLRADLRRGRGRARLGRRRARHQLARHQPS